jgi:hypothetical protein
MVHVLVGTEIQEQGRVALQPEREGSDHGTFDAMRPTVLQRLFDGSGGIALGLEVLREIDEEILDSPRRGEASQRTRRRQAETALLRESDPGGERHA